MENLRVKSNAKIPRLKLLNDVAPMEMMLAGRGRYQQSMSPRVDPYVENIDFGSPLARYLSGGSPAMINQTGSNISASSGFGCRGRLAFSPRDNLEITPLRSPVKLEEEVLVMDDILVGSMLGNKGGRSSSSSGGSSLSSSAGKNIYKAEICRTWEESQTCRYGSKCQFIHGKEELRPTRSSVKNKSEPQTSKSTASAGSSTFGTKSRFNNQLDTGIELEVSDTASQPPSPAKPETADSIHLTLVTAKEWTPLDDGIDVVLPHSIDKKPPSRVDVAQFIHTILYCPALKRRLPAFAEICPDRRY